jgi:hypothetical protein
VVLVNPTLSCARYTSSLRVHWLKCLYINWLFIFLYCICIVLVLFISGATVHGFPVIRTDQPSRFGTQVIRGSAD